MPDTRVVNQWDRTNLRFIQQMIGIAASLGISEQGLKNISARQGNWDTPDDFAQCVLDEIDWHKWRDNPLVRRYTSNFRGARIARNQHHFPKRFDAPPITSAWEAEAERLMYAMLITAPGTRLSFNSEDLASAPEKLNLLGMLVSGVTYLWRPEVYEKARMLPVPRHTISEDLLPNGSMYCTWEGTWDVRLTHDVVTRQMTESFTNNPETLGDSSRFLEFEADGMMMAHDSENNVVVFWIGVIPETGSVHANMLGTLRVGTTWPDDYSEQEQITLTRVLAMLSFLNSPYVSTERERIPRSIRREMERSKVANLDTEPRIHVVKLREVSTPGGFAHGTGREFRHQWWVRGHIRAQWFPSKKGHNLIWIREHLKGPHDAPMISKIYDVKR